MVETNVAERITDVKCPKGMKYKVVTTRWRTDHGLRETSVYHNDSTFEVQGVKVPVSNHQSVYTEQSSGIDVAKGTHKEVVRQVRQGTLERQI